MRTAGSADDPSGGVEPALQWCNALDSRVQNRCSVAQSHGGSAADDEHGPVMPSGQEREVAVAGHQKERSGRGDVGGGQHEVGALPARGFDEFHSERGGGFWPAQCSNGTRMAGRDDGYGTRRTPEHIEDGLKSPRNDVVRVHEHLNG